MDNLKSCPFCGKEQLDDIGDDGNIPYDNSMSHICDYCNATVERDWNRRPLEDALQAELDEEIPYIDKFHIERDIAIWKQDIAVEAISKIRQVHSPIRFMEQSCPICNALLGYEDALAEIERKD